MDRTRVTRRTTGCVLPSLVLGALRDEKYREIIVNRKPTTTTASTTYSIVWTFCIAVLSFECIVTAVGTLLERRVGVRYIVPLREGGSLPAVVDTEDGSYVVKFRGAGQGQRALVAEALAAGLALHLGLPVPAPAIVRLDEGFGRAEPDPE